jgi:hypothetical protein
MANTAKSPKDEILDTGECEHDAGIPALAPEDPLDAMDVVPLAAPEVLSDLGRERVRFVAPLWIRGEGEHNDCEGVLLNLSSHGLACALSSQLGIGERTWARFRLALASEPLKLLCEVLWSRPAQNAVFLYGLRFVSLNQQEASELNCVIDERVHGRAAEWPLPVIPDTRPSLRPARRTRLPVVGVAAAVVFMAVAGVWLLSPPGSRAASPMHVRDKAGTVTTTAPKPTPVETLIEPGVDEPMAPTAAAVPTATPAHPVATATPSSLPPEHPTAAEKPPVALKATAPASRNLPRRASPVPPSPNDDTLRPLGTRDSVELALLTDGPIDEHAEFWLDNPQRLVVDILHRKSGFSRLSYAIDSPLLTKMRVGDHSDKVRFVIETSREVSQEFKVRPRGNSLILRFKRR